MDQPSLCDRCRMPGRCCTGFSMPLVGPEAGTAEVERQLRDVRTGISRLTGRPVRLGPARPEDEEHVDHLRVGLPFRPLWKRPDGHWRYWCPHLTRAGRCGIYATRPALCRHFQPGQDPLCAEHVPAAEQEPQDAG